ncbi:MAG: VIT1/CCC1 transporter family protein [Verrucomicrobiota bacterium]
MATDHSSTNAPDHNRPLSFFARHLDLNNRLSEVVFGLIMALTFTLGAGLVVQEGRQATLHMLLGILGCNIAWGLIDAGMYVLSCVFDRSRKARLLQTLQKSTHEAESLAMVGRALDGPLEPLTSPAERHSLYRSILVRLKNVTPERTRLTSEDLYGALVTFCLVLITAVPAVLPFLVIGNPFVALRASNGLLLACLFGVGYRCARATNNNPWIFGLALLVAGLVMVGIALALGG